jgi:hypothetical protein
MRSLTETANVHRDRLIRHVDRLNALAEIADAGTSYALRAGLEDELRFLEEQLVPHMQAIETTLYERLERLMDGRHSMAPMRSTRSSGGSSRPSVATAPLSPRGISGRWRRWDCGASCTGRTRSCASISPRRRSICASSSGTSRPRRRRASPGGSTELPDSACSDSGATCEQRTASTAGHQRWRRWVLPSARGISDPADAADAAVRRPPDTGRQTRR